MRIADKAEVDVPQRPETSNTKNIPDKELFVKKKRDHEESSGSLL